MSRAFAFLAAMVRGKEDKQVSADGACVAAGAQPLRLQLLHLQPSMLRRKHLVRCLRLHGGVKEATSQRPCQPPQRRVASNAAITNLRLQVCGGGVCLGAVRSWAALLCFAIASGGVARVPDGAVSAYKKEAHAFLGANRFRTKRSLVRLIGASTNCKAAWCTCAGIQRLIVQRHP